MKQKNEFYDLKFRDDFSCTQFHLHKRYQFLNLTLNSSICTVLLNTTFSIMAITTMKKLVSTSDFSYLSIIYILGEAF